MDVGDIDRLERQLLDALSDPDNRASLPVWKDANDLTDIGLAALRGQTAQAMGTIDRTSDRPPYRQIADLIRAAIEDGQYRDGDRLPSESELITHFSVARMTVRAAIQRLRTDGLVRAEHGRGVFVCDPASRSPAGPLNLDDLVALADVIGHIIGSSLSPEQSSRLKRAYELAQGGPALAAVARAARRVQ